MNRKTPGTVGVRLWAVSLVCLVGITIWLLMPSYRAVFSSTGRGAQAGIGERLPDGPAAGGTGSRSSQLVSSGASSDGAAYSSAGHDLAMVVSAGTRDAAGLGSAGAEGPSASSRTSNTRAGALTGAASPSGNHGAGGGAGASGHASGAGGGARGGAASGASSTTTTADHSNDAAAEPGLESAALSSIASEAAGRDSDTSAGSPSTASPSSPSPKGDGRSGSGLLTLDDVDSLHSFQGTPTGDSASMPDLFSSPAGSSISSPSGSLAGGPGPAAALDALVADLGGAPGELPGAAAPTSGRDLVASPVVAALVVVPSGEGSAALPPDAHLDLGAPPAGDVVPAAEQPGSIPEPSLSLLSALGIGASALARRYRRNRQ